MATIYARATRCRRPLTSHVRTLYMSWSREGGRSGPRGYHHGNLKEALIPRGAGTDRAEGTRRFYLRGGCPLGGGESGGALPAFPRPRRTIDRCGTAWLRSIRGYA